MSYRIIPTENFKDQVRTLIKKYPNIRSDLKNLNQKLIETPKFGASLGRKSYKIRLKCSDIQKGKRSGYRVITHISDNARTVWLLAIYIKSEKTNIQDREITMILQKEGLA